MNVNHRPTVGGLVLTALMTLSSLTVVPVHAASAPVPNVSAGDWAGYGSSKNVSSVLMSFVQPKVTCNPRLSQDQSVFWLAHLGSPGVTVQIAVWIEAFCAQGSSSPVYSNSVSSSVSVIPGHAYEISFRYILPKTCGFNPIGTEITITDLTVGHGATIHGCPHVHLSLPSQCVVASANEGGTDIPLANFTKTGFGFDNTGASGTCSATLNGGTIHKFAMRSDLSGGAMASTSALSSDLSSFKASWVSAGP